MSILESLARNKIIKEDDIPGIEAEAASSGLSVEQVLLARGVPTEALLEGRGAALSVPVRVVDTVVPGKVLEYIPEESARHYQIAPLGVADGVLEVGAVDPEDIEARDALTFISGRIGMPYKIFLISPDDFDKVLDMYKGLTGEVTKALGELETEINVAEESAETKKDKKGEETIVEDAPVTKIVATIINHASEANASDIHIEPLRENIRVRFRVDGELNTSLVLPTKVHSAVVARIKILSNMRLDEKRKPQDGRFSATVTGDRKVDFRVSTFPSYYGEKVVMRLLDQEKGVKTMEKLSITETNIALIRKALKRPYGLILISGPTGSGKSTTLYSMMSEVDREHLNVLSLEDPVEYSMDGVAQSQVHPEIDYTFASGLRTTLRQDPDVIMVGEIRDKETAQLAIQAALTGHIVLSTIHTNNAVGVIPRLIDMGVDPYLIAPTLSLAIAQRLVRTLAPGGSKPVPLTESMKLMVEKQFESLPAEYKKNIKFGTEFYDPVPTKDNPTGLKGRMAVMEMLEMDKELESVILKNPTEIEIMRVARAKGMLTMKEDAILKAFQGLVPFEEINTL